MRKTLFLVPFFFLQATSHGLDSIRSARPRSYRPVSLRNGKVYFHIPPDSRLARNEHPRFLLVKEDIAALKRRIKNPIIAAEFRAVCRQALEQARTSSIGLFKCALAYKLTGDRKYLEALKNSPNFHRPTWIFGWPAAIDLVWDELRGLSLIHI